jgi:thiol:disulfide interchange protein DsbA
MKTQLARILLALFLGMAGIALGAEPVAGREYLVLDPPRPAAGGNRIEVIEFFSYGCPFCYATEPYLTRWLNRHGTDVAMKRVPSVLPPAWAPYARIYYALEAAGLLERLHWPVFDNVHFDGRPLYDEKTLLAWLSRNGVDAVLFRQTMHSPQVEAKLATARTLLDTYDIHGVPTFVVDGRYVTSARLAGGVEHVMPVVDALVERARKEHRGSE